MKTDNIFKEGDKVYHFLYGWGKVVKLLNNNNQFWVRVQFDKQKIGFEDNFRDGFLLSFTEYTLEGFSQERIEELLNEGDIVWVRNEHPGNWAIGHFYKKLDDYYYVSNYVGEKDWSKRGLEITNKNPYEK